jgi:uncharacterized protein (DUF885 family)
VVDTGMHAKGWDRARAVAYFQDNTPRKELDITNEIDRYIAWPGQALAYKMGQLMIRKLRDEAKTQLGSKFDIKAFHDEILNGGAMPLDLLQERVERWVAHAKAQTA